MTPWVSAGSNTNSSSVLSPFAPTRASIQSVTPMPAAIALRSWGQRSPLTPWFHRVIHELRRTPRMPGRLTVTVPLVDIGGNTLPHLHRVWLARLELHIRINTKRTASQAIRESSTSNTETRSSCRVRRFRSIPNCLRGSFAINGRATTLHRTRFPRNGRVGEVFQPKQSTYLFYLLRRCDRR